MLHRSMPTQENHEVRFPAPSMPKRAAPAHTALGTGSLCGTSLQGRLGGSLRIGEVPYRSLIMKWETPAAAEIRFGFEITMYVANR